MKNIFKFLNFLFPIFKTNFVLFFIFTILSIFFETISLVALIPAFNFLISDTYSLFGGKIDFILVYLKKIEFLNYEYFVIVIIFIIFVFKNLFLMFYQIWQSLFVLKIEKYLASELFKKYLNQDMIFHLNTHSGTLIRNMTVEIKNVTKSISALFVLIIEISMTIALFSLLLYFLPKEAITISIAIGLFLIFIIFFTSSKIKYLSKKRAEIDKKYNKNLIESFNTVNEIKLMDKILFFSIIHDNLKNKYYYNLKKFVFLNSIPRPLMETIIISIICAFVFVSLNNKSQLINILSTLGLFGVAGLRLLPAFSRIIVSYQSLKFKYISFKILFNELNSEIETLDFQTNNQLIEYNENTFREKINFVNISFSYGDKTIIENFNFEIKKNKFLFIHGKSGSGKSTLLNLLMGLLKPTKGQILLDGKIDIHHQINKWRKIISYVPQQIYLLDESVEKNIAFGQNTNDIDQTILKNVIDVSKLGSFMRENDKQNYRLGEKGLKISGGQAQRLGVARALYRKPEILLLDESTNGLDYETEKSFLQDLVQLKKNLTIIFVSHREHVKEYADEVLEIEKLNFLRND